MTLRTTKRNLAVVLRNGHLVGQTEATFQIPVKSIHRKWIIILDDGTAVAARTYFKNEIASEEKRRRPQAQRQRERQAKAKAEIAAACESFSALPTIESISYGGRIGDLKWKDGRLWIVRHEIGPQDLTDLFLTLNPLTNFSLAQYNDSGLLRRIQKACPEFAALRKTHLQHRREVRAFERLQRAEDAKRLAEETRLKAIAAEEERRRYWSTAELLALPNTAWTRHRVRKYLGEPDKVEQFTCGRYWDRKDVTRYLWLKDRVAHVEGELAAA